MTFNVDRTKTVILEKYDLELLLPFFFFFFRRLLQLLRAPLWAMTTLQKNRALPDFMQGINCLKLVTNLMCVFTAHGVMQYFPFFSVWTIKLNTYFHSFHVQGKALLPFKTWEQEVFPKQPYWGIGQRWPLVPLQFSSALTQRYVQFAPWPWVLPDRSNRQTEPGSLHKFPFNWIFLIQTFKWLKSRRDLCVRVFSFSPFLL